MNIIKQLIVSCLLLTGLAACDRPECSNTNPILARFAPDTKEYKAELARQIRNIGPEKLRYWFDRYEQQGGREYIIVHIQGKELCAKGHLQVDNWEKIEGLRGEPKGYSGAELAGLDIRISEEAGETQFYYAGLDRIID